MKELRFKGKKCCTGKRGGIYIHKKGGGKRYLTKKEKKGAGFFPSMPKTGLAFQAIRAFKPRNVARVIKRVATAAKKLTGGKLKKRAKKGAGILPSAVNRGFVRTGRRKMGLREAVRSQRHSEEPRYMSKKKRGGKLKKK